MHWPVFFIIQLLRQYFYVSDLFDYKSLVSLMAGSLIIYYYMCGKYKGTEETVLLEKRGEAEFIPSLQPSVKDHVNEPLLHRPHVEDLCDCILLHTVDYIFTANEIVLCVVVLGCSLCVYVF